MTSLATLTADIIAAGQGARSRLADYALRGSGIASDPALSPRGKSDALTALTTTARTDLEGTVTGMRTKVAVFITAVQGRLDATRTVPDADMAAAAARLSPVISNAVANPDGLLASYARCFSTLVDRVLLEGVAASVMDTLSGTDAMRFRERWDAQRAGLLAGVPQAEQDAAADLTGVADLDTYCDAIARVISVGLDEIEAMDNISFTADLTAFNAAATAGRRARDGSIARSCALAVINGLESGNGIVWKLGGF